MLIVVSLFIPLVVGAPVPPAVDDSEPCLCSRFYDGTKAEQARIADRIVNEARAEAGLPPLAAGQAMMRGHIFFTQTHGHTVCGDEQFAYRTVWKGGNNFVREQLHTTCNSTWEGGNIVPDNHFIFSFVRDPFSHFMSGYREATYRTFETCCHIPTEEGQIPTNREFPADEFPSKCRYDCGLFVGDEGGSTQLAKAFIHDLLELHLLDEHGVDHNLDFMHVALMSANLFGDKRQRKPDFIGNLEAIDTDWARMCSAENGDSRCPPHLTTYGDLDTGAGQHPQSSSDKYGHGAGLKKAFEEAPHLEKAVRKLLSLDDDCLHGYMESSQAARKQTTAGHRRSMLVVGEDRGEIMLEPWLER